MVDDRAATSEPSVLRKEDAEAADRPRHLRRQPDDGRAWLWMQMVRPPYVHARIDRIDTSAADVDARRDRRAHRGRPGGRVPLGPADGLADHRGHQGARPTGRSRRTRSGSGATPWRSSSPRPASRPRMPPRPSSSRPPSSPVVLDLEEAAKDEVVIHEDLGTNKVVHWSHGGAGDQSIFESAPVIVQERYTQPRLIPNAIEPRGCLAYGIPAAGEFTLGVGHADPAHLPGRRSPSRPASRSRSSASSRRTSVAASARSWTSTRRRRSRWRSRAASVGPSSGSRVVRRTTWRRSTDGACCTTARSRAPRTGRSSG